MPLICLVAALGLSPLPDPFETRRGDWRVGPVVYQVFVDRFAPSKNLEAKRALIRPPRTLKAWSDLPKPGSFIKSLGMYSHELEFWGGDLASLESHLDYVKQLGTDVLYLNPIHRAYSNHKYDAQDFKAIDPGYGTFTDLSNLQTSVHSSGMKLILDGVFNHLGKSSKFFTSANSSSESEFRNWFYFDKSYPDGYRGWAGVPNLPALNLENRKVRDYLWNSPDSVVRKYLANGADGWRLDVGFEIGPNYLSELTRAAHQTKPGSDVIGEISGYPSDWFPSVDGVFNFFSMSLVGQMLGGKIGGGVCGAALNHQVEDAGIENTLRSWLLIDNHDTPRLASTVPDLPTRKLLWSLQMTLPGSPVVYYGTELGMTGSGDPQNRAPMRWDLVSKDNENLNWVSKMIRVRKANPALRFGNFEALDTSKLLAFSRTTDKVLDTCIVVVNPTNSEVEETFPTRVGRLMSWGSLSDILTGERIRTVNGILTIKMRPRSIGIFRTDPLDLNGYSPYHRIP